MEVASAVTLADAVVEFTLKLSGALSAETRSKLLKTHGRPFGLGLFLFWRGAYEQLERMEDQILHRRDEDIEKYRLGYLNEWGMSAIAVSSPMF